MARTLKGMVKGAKSDPLTPLIDRYLLERPHGAPFRIHPTVHVRSGGRFTPSSSGDRTKCMRAAVLQFMQVPKKVKRDPETELIFEVGDYTHLLWFNLFCHMEEVLGSDVFEVVNIEQPTVYPSLLLAGWYDVHIKIRGRSYLVDFKTINDAGFTTIMDKKAPKEDNLGQLVRYLFSARISRGMLVYLNKNDQRWKVFVVHHKDHLELWKKCKRWYRQAIRHLQNQSLPAMHDDCDSSQSRMAKWCPYSYMCYGKFRDEDIGAQAYADKPPYDALWMETTGHHLAAIKEASEAKVHTEAPTQKG